MTRTQQENKQVEDTMIGKTIVVNGREHKVLSVHGGRYGVKVEDLVRGGEFNMEAKTVLYCEVA